VVEQLEKTDLCSACKYKDCVRVSAIEVENPDLMVVGEAPGAEEERSGLPFVGPSGRILRQAMTDMGFDFTKIAVANVVLCRPPKNETPRKAEMNLCAKQFLFPLIQRLSPKLIMCAGSVAGSMFKEDKWEGIPVVKVLHPAALLYSPEKVSDFKSGLRRVYNALYCPVYDRKLVVVDSLDNLDILKEWMIGRKDVGTDIETNGTLDPFNKDARITHIAFAGEKMAFSVWLDKPDDPVFTEQAASFVKKVLMDDTILHIFHRSWFDVKFLQSRGFEVKKFADTRVKAFLLNENRMIFGLKDLAMEHIGPYEYTIEETDPVRFSLYNAEDAWFTYKLNGIFDSELSKPLKKVAERLIMPVIPVLNEMMLTGMKVDQAQADKVRKLVAESRDTAYKDLVGTFKEFEGVNLRSPKQMQEVIFGKLKESPVKETKTGYSVDEETLNSYAGKGKDWARLVVKYRQQEKLLSTYIDKIPKIVNYDGRIRTQFDPVGTVSGRIASRNVNLQNIPRNNEIYKLFVADTGKVFFYFDFAQIELRTAASIAPEYKMIRAFQEHADLHVRTAVMLNGKKSEDITKEERQLAKGVSFGLLYGQQAEGLKQYLFDKFEIDISLDEAERIRGVYFKSYPGLPSWHKRVLREVYDRHRVVYPTGRIRRFPAAGSENKIPGRIIRQAVNAPNQGSANDIMLFVLSNLHRLKTKAKLPAKFVLTVHDSAMLVIEDLKDMTNMILSDVLPKDKLFTWLRVPIEAEFKVGKSWGELEEL